MMAISLRSPWWWFILHAGKNIENRDWSTRYRGPVLIHVSKWFNPDDVRDDFRYAKGCVRPQGRDLPTVTLSDIRAMGGMLVGTCRIVDCIDRADPRSQSPWFQGRYGFVLEDPKPLPQPIPWKGERGLFKVDGINV